MKKLAINGIDARTGQYLPIGEPAAEPTPPPREAAPEPAERGLLPYNVEPANPVRAGWGVLWGPNTPDAVRKALLPLLELRKGQVEGDRFHEIELKPGETADALLERHGIGGGAIDPSLFPYYVLIVGGPEAASWDLQHGLSTMCAVGRLSFSGAAEFGRYADSVVAVETAAASATQPRLACWGPRHPGDEATALSADHLIKPLEAEFKKAGVSTSLTLGPSATKASLLELLAGKKQRPSILFTASHGLGFSPNDPGQESGQGALLTMDWPGVGSAAAAHAVSAADVADDAQVGGSIAFIFACYGAGTPRTDEFPFDPARKGGKIAKKPFVAALPNRLLSHPRGGALAVIGHVERAWAYSIQPAAVGPTLMPFSNTVGRLLQGEPAGHAMHDFPDRYTLSAALLLRHYDATSAAGKLDPDSLISRWIECADARNYVLLGDPAVRLK